ncbi:aldo/keto reductase [Chitinophaga sp. Ak27]|uniref:aldo/keto reductase n=1 Tax=Chitinophaga sp. Ak27 TaxID=2726116 RepID=UPI00145F96B6|nr:aldo/keto reductase [Chitinophaga sp. Ak27]NLU94397.1 aldo/keto reductase [Chitinophaga sp. Ak27]
MNHLTRVSKLILGTVQFGTRYGINNQAGQPTASSVFKIFDVARNAGVVNLDTAEDYGTAQQIIGDYHANHDLGDRFEVISKISHGFVGGSIEGHLLDSLSVLKLHILEGYLFHNYQMYRNSPELLTALVGLKERGWVKKIGVSVYSNEQIAAAITDRQCDIIQIPFNLLDNFTQKGYLLEKAKELGKEIHVRSVYLQGLFFMESSLIPAYLRPLEPYLSKIKALAEEAAVNLESLALQYIAENEHIDKMLIGVDSVEQLTENISALSAPLDKAIFKEIDKIKVQETPLLNPVNWK